FQTFHPAIEENFIYAGNTVVPIEGFGHIMATIQAPEGPRQIELKDVAYIPSFHTTVASLEKFVSKDVYWDTKNNHLTYQGRTFCYLERHYNQWTLEFQELQEESIFLAHTSRAE